MDRTSSTRTTEPSHIRRQLKAAAALGLSQALATADGLDADLPAGPLAELDTWLAKHLPDVAASLNPGASEQQLDRLASIIGAPLPADYRALYRWHNGQDASCVGTQGPWFGLFFPSLDRVEAIWRSWLDFADDPWCEFNELAVSFRPGAVKPLYANRGWIPFAQAGHNCLGIDLDPDAAGSVGQVINFGRDEDLKYVLAPGLAAFVPWLVGQLHAGNFKLQPQRGGGQSFNTARPSARHFFEAIPVLFDEGNPS